MNIAIIAGRLASDPVLRTTNNNTPVCNLRVITNEVWYDSQGVKQTEATGHDVVVWNRQATATAQYRRKGDWVCVVGRTQERQFAGKCQYAGTKQDVVDGNGQLLMINRYSKEIVADRVEFVGNKAAANAYADAAATALTQTAPMPAAAPAAPAAATTVVGPGNAAPVQNPLFPTGV